MPALPKYVVVFLSCVLLAWTGEAMPPSVGSSGPAEPLPTRGGAQRRALLVGINDYESSVPPGQAAPPGRGFRNLHGATGDARQFQEMLVARFGFRQEDVVVLTDAAATRQAILDHFDHHLLTPSQAGDTVLFYFAGHGSQVVNSLSDEPDRRDESLVPADAARGVPDIRDKELRERLNRLLDRGVVPTVILDSCHSGSGTRGLPTGAEPRALALDPRDAKDPGPFGPDPADRGALILSAARPEEFAWETRDDDGGAHGAFTWALLQALREVYPGEAAEETFQRVRGRLHSELRRQEPVLEGHERVRRSPLFGTGEGASPGPARGVVAVERLDADGSVIVQGGWANGLTVGSRLTWAPPGGPREELEIAEMLGLARARARRSHSKVGRAVEATPTAGALLTVSGWAAELGRVLRVALPTSAMALGEVRALGDQLTTLATRRGISWVRDPTTEPPTHVLRPHGTSWELLELGAAPRRFPQGVSARDVLREIPNEARLFFQVPFPADLVRRFEIGPGTPNDGIEPTSDLTVAAAVLVGRLVGGAIEYAWVRPDSSAGASRLPAATPWRPSAAEATADQLQDDLFHLRKLHGWLTLGGPAQGVFGYRLTLVEGSTQAARGLDAPLRENETFTFRLEAKQGMSSERLQPRYVYVFLIDSAGNSVLLYGLKTDDNPQPYGFVPGQLPARVALGGGPSVRVKPPFGRDHYFLLTSDEPLPTPWVLEYRGFRPRGPRGASALEELLSLTGGTTRGAERLVTPTEWSIESWSFVSTGAGAGAGAGAGI